MSSSVALHLMTRYMYVMYVLFSVVLLQEKQKELLGESQRISCAVSHDIFHPFFSLLLYAITHGIHQKWLAKVAWAKVHVLCTGHRTKFCQN